MALTLKEIEELDAIKIRIENCIAQADAQRNDIENMLSQNSGQIRALNLALKSVNGFLNSVIVEEKSNARL